MFHLHQNSILRHAARHMFRFRSFIANCSCGRAAQRPGCCPAAGLLPSGRAAAPAHSSSEKLGGVKAPQQLSRSSGCIPRTTPHALDVSTSRLDVPQSRLLRRHRTQRSYQPLHRRRLPCQNLRKGVNFSKCTRHCTLGHRRIRFFSFDMSNIRVCFDRKLAEEM